MTQTTHCGYRLTETDMDNLERIRVHLGRVLRSRVCATDALRHALSLSAEALTGNDRLVTPSAAP